MTQQLARDMAVVRQRSIERLTAGAGRYAGATKRWMQELRPDGSWPDVDYAHRDRSAWKTAGHLSRLRTMAAVYRCAGQDLSQDPKLRDTILLALGYWLENDFKNPNWWWNEIGVPMSLGPVMLLMGDDVPKAHAANAVKILGRARLGKGTGQNLVWLTELAMSHATLQGRPEVVAKAFERIGKEIRITDKEGIQPDFSFHQHGAQLYSGGYGFGFSLDCPRLAVLASGTAFAFPSEKLEILSSYILDGQQWLVRGTTFDHAAVGREITRRGRGGKARSLIGACENMIRLDPQRKEEFQAFAARVRAGKATKPNHLSGHRHFWRSDFTAHHRLGYYASVKMSSKRVRGWEIVNNEGVRSHHTADGMNLLYLDGKEYEGIFPAWDWQRIPGTTCQQLKQPFRGRDSRGKTTFVGGVSDGHYGLAAMDFVEGKLHARKAWFFFDGEYVCLGAGITCSTDNPVLTSVNQCHLRGEVTTSDSEGQAAATGLWWAHHDRVGYVFPDASRRAVKVAAGPQTGSWKNINRRYPKDPVTLPVFNLWIDHGARPQAASYVYTVAPGVDADAMRNYELPVDVVANTPSIQCVRHRDLRLACIAFYQAGKASVAENLTVGVDQPCLLMIHERDGHMQVATSNPENQPVSLTVTVSRKLTGPACAWDADAKVSRVTIELPAGSHAGQSVVGRYAVVE